MNATGRKIVNGCLVGLRAVDPAGADELMAALASLSGRPPKTEDQALLWTQARTARALGMSRWSVRLLTRDGKLHPVALRGVRRYRKVEVLALAGESD